MTENIAIEFELYDLPFQSYGPERNGETDGPMGGWKAAIGNAAPWRDRRTIITHSLDRLTVVESYARLLAVARA